MNLFSIDINSIVDLGTHVATTGALRMAETSADELFEYIIGIIILVYEVNP